MDLEQRAVYHCTIVQYVPPIIVTYRIRIINPSAHSPRPFPSPNERDTFMPLDGGFYKLHLTIFGVGSV